MKRKKEAKTIERNGKKVRVCRIEETTQWEVCNDN
jgi:hypothetical protein